MALDFARARHAQQKIQTKGKTFEKKDYTKIYYKPVAGEQVVRIVPFKNDKTWPIIDVELHSYDAFKKNIPSLRNFQEKDPIIDFRKRVFDQGTEEEKADIKKFAPKVSRFVQVIVRGQEGLGVRLWELKGSYQALVNILNKEEHYGDITDIVEGRDLILDGVSETKVIGGKSVTFVTAGITPSGKASPLSKDASQVEEWLENQHIPLEQYKKYNFDEIYAMLESYLTPDDGVDNEEESAPPEQTPAAKAVATLKAKPAAAPVKKAAPVVQEAEEIEAEEITGEDELSDVIPNVAPTPAPAKKTPEKAPAKPAATSFTKSFKSMFVDEDGE